MEHAIIVMKINISSHYFDLERRQYRILLSFGLFLAMLVSLIIVKWHLNYHIQQRHYQHEIAAIDQQLLKKTVKNNWVEQFEQDSTQLKLQRQQQAQYYKSLITIYKLIQINSKTIAWRQINLTPKHCQLELHFQDLQSLLQVLNILKQYFYQVNLANIHAQQAVINFDYPKKDL